LFIGHYKGVNSSIEFYSEQRKDLNFPTQVLYKKERYLLNKTIQISSDSQGKNIVSMAKKMNIEYDVKID
jgi:hypothetical protein